LVVVGHAIGVAVAGRGADLVRAARRFAGAHDAAEIVGAAEAEEARNAGRVDFLLREQRRADEVGRAAPRGVAIGHAHVGRAGGQDVGQAAGAGLTRFAGMRAAGLKAELVVLLEVTAARVDARRLGRETDAPHRITAVTVLGAGRDRQAHTLIVDE